jgi:hypothetical protein
MAASGFRAPAGAHDFFTLPLPAQAGTRRCARRRRSGFGTQWSKRIRFTPQPRAPRGCQHTDRRLARDALERLEKFVQAHAVIEIPEKRIQ